MSSVGSTSFCNDSGEGGENTLRIFQTGSGLKLDGIEELIQNLETIKGSESATKISCTDTFKWSSIVYRLDWIGAKYWFDEFANNITITKPSSLQSIPVVVHHELLGETLKECTGALKYAGKLYTGLAQTIVDKESHRRHTIKADLLLRMRGKPVIAFECAITRHRKNAIDKASVWLKNPKMMAVIVFSVDEAYPYIDPSTPASSSHANLKTLQEFKKASNPRNGFPIALDGHIFCSNIHCRFEIIQRTEDIPTDMPAPEDIRNKLTYIQKEENVSTSLASVDSYKYNANDAKRFNCFLNESVKKAAALHHMPEADFDYHIDWDYHKECLEETRPQYAYHRYRASPWFKINKRVNSITEAIPGRPSKRLKFSDGETVQFAGRKEARASETQERGID